MAGELVGTEQEGVKGKPLKSKRLAEQRLAAVRVVGMRNWNVGMEYQVHVLREAHSGGTPRVRKGETAVVAVTVWILLYCNGKN